MSQGQFSGNPTTEWMEEAGPDRNMKLLSEFFFIDPDGRKWFAPKDSVVNGASIPEALWSSVGSPYTGDYRRASIVHDIACDTPTVNRAEADKMFYFACLAGGCSKLQAKLLYAGVRIGAWTSNLLPEGYVAEAAVLPEPRLPNQHTIDELVVRAKYTLIAQKLAETPDDFEAIEAAVDSEIAK